MASLTEFTNKYSKQLTLKNELIPVGQTLENIKKNGFIEGDEQLNENYKKAKKIVDDFLKDFINKTLNNIQIGNWSELADALKNDDEDNLKKIQGKFRGIIVSKFDQFDMFSAYSIEKELSKKDDHDVDKADLDKGKTNSSLGYIFNKNLFKIVLPQYLKSEQEKLNTISYFDNFFTYFSGFFDNRKNIFTEEAISTSIPYRIVHDNFPKFLSNLNCFNVWLKECPQEIENVENSLKENNVIDKQASLASYFTVNAYDKFLSQEGIDLYNNIIGGLPAASGKEKVQGLNEVINLACQKNNDLKIKLKKQKAIKMATLFKQILSDRKKIFIDAFETDEQLIEIVKEFYNKQWQDNSGFKVLIELINSIQTMTDDELSGIFIHGQQFNYVSKLVYGGNNWSRIRNDIEIYLNGDLANNEIKKKYKKNKKDLDKTVNGIELSLNDLNTIIKKESESDAKFSDLLSKKIYSDFESLVKVNEGEWPTNLKEENSKQKIKAPLDAILSLYNELEIFKSKSFNKSSIFYVDFDKAMFDLSDIVPLYNKSRNYCTKKEYSNDKFKLNFKSPQLGIGYSYSKEKDYLTILLKKDRFYYVGILNKGTKIDFESESAIASNNEDCYEKMKYYLIPQANRYLPKNSLLSSKYVVSHFRDSNDDYVIANKNFNKTHVITKHIYDIYHQKTYLKDSKNPDEKYRKPLRELITFLQDFIHNYKSTNEYNFNKLKDPSAYTDINDFYKDVDDLGYQLFFTPIKTSFIDASIKNGELYLFRINNKDFSQKTTGVRNLHTMYFEAIFDKTNLDNHIIQLNGNAELFYRKESLKNKQIIHKEGSYLVNKVCKNGETLPDKIRNEIYQYKNNYIATLSDEAKKVLPNVIVKKATHDITKDKRFTTDKYFFHCPITINYTAEKPNQFNGQVLSFLRNNPDINIIGIDRGERNLIYVTVINQKGEILESVSFNSITNKSSKIEQTVDYEEKLALREKERIEAKRSWDSISKIATLKEGYLSRVVHDICLLMIKHNAIVVLENLNAGFKRIRGGLSEKSVYQKFEKMLINKLNYFVSKKESDWNKPSGLLKGLQLSDQFESFEKLGIQSGFIFYVPAAYTSKIDPTTGFANVLNLSKISNIELMKTFFSNFNEISYSKKENLFKFSFDLDFLSKKGFSSFVNFSKTKWDVYTFGERIIKPKNDQGYREDKRIDLTEEMKNLLNEYKVSFDLENNLISYLTSANLKDSFWGKLFSIFKTTLQLRNSVTNGKEDVLISPVKNAKGEFFVSGPQNKTLPQDCDANGAYHIALKGLMILERNNLVKEEKETKKIMAISNVDWFEYVQKRSGVLK